jgi:hypothetical protein
MLFASLRIISSVTDSSIIISSHNATVLELKVVS